MEELRARRMTRQEWACLGVGTRRGIALLYSLRAVLARLFGAQHRVGCVRSCRCSSWSSTSARPRARRCLCKTREPTPTPHTPSRPPTHRALHPCCCGSARTAACRCPPPPAIRSRTCTSPSTSTRATRAATATGCSSCSSVRRAAATRPAVCRNCESIRKVGRSSSGWSAKPSFPSEAAALGPLGGVELKAFPGEL